MSDTNRLLQDALDAARDADSDLIDCLPLPDDLDEFLDEWDVPAEDREMFKGLAVEFESVVMRQNCHTTWAPEYFQHLAKVLGYGLPQGVLE
ncbi:hypothetical protein SEA_COLT_256 [Mycobacterium phage Colt]|uniref:DUF7340 domain-containing protein n=1 Tax=Mycobacterium phage Cane17 TaxID=2301548 RepID=A0A346N950_9CAUD|nr:hypothetical protein KHO59_gp073 [Mycobacterium phage Cane17]AXQ51835.1 hypothetical protein SEA_CANE17_255 [Mycobacterium phage Cane17]QAY14170.1 hypothetical protein SEA_COLT_256 [Mycobacterium phage Colt]